jgi:hypothetical protein
MGAKEVELKPTNEELRAAVKHMVNANIPPIACGKCGVAFYWMPWSGAEREPPPQHCGACGSGKHYDRIGQRVSAIDSTPAAVGQIRRPPSWYDFGHFGTATSLRVALVSGDSAYLADDTACVMYTARLSDVEQWPLRD